MDPETPRPPDPPPGDEDVEFTLANEFAAVRVTVDRSGNSHRLVVRDLRGERQRHFDPLVLESLVWLPDEILDALNAPAVTRWDTAEAVREIIEDHMPSPPQRPEA